jgi:Glutathione S-transferase, N-terminal domain
MTMGAFETILPQSEVRFVEDPIAGSAIGRAPIPNNAFSPCAASRRARRSEVEMPIINTSSAEARNLKGLHLYHFSMSNCSQKARLCLEEKGLQWTSHPVDLVHNEHLTPEFVAINPKALVPVLVHDGVVVTESSDIIDYLRRCVRLIRPS